jgi:3-hydroxyisobutyrate dehydrogenase
MMANHTNLSVGYIGLGNMGQPMAMCLLNNGFQLTTWARNPDKAVDLVARGARALNNAADVTRASDIVFTCVTDTNAVRNIVFGEGGIAEGAGNGKVLVDMSSIEPAATVEMANRLKAEAGMGWIDAPVSGTPTACLEGKLTVMAGGSDEDFARAKPVIDVLAGRLTHMGPGGAGQTTKLVNQTLVGGSLALVAEAIRFAQDAGVDASQIPVALAGGRADSPVLQEWGSRMAIEDYAATAAVDIMLKDLNMVSGASKKLGTPMPVLAAANNTFQQASRMGFGQLDVCAVKKVYDGKAD